MQAEEIERLLNVKIDATYTVRSALAKQFISWATKQVNNFEMFDPTVQEITALVRYGFPGQTMTDEQKIDIMLKLQKLGIVFNTSEATS